ncbi:MAG: DUF6371 domain-containing protein [Ferruginibacter sp.]
MNSYKYILEPYKGRNTRYRCPSCSQNHKFTRYINAATGEYLADHIGRCDRQDSCGYHMTPKMFLIENPVFNDYSKNWKKAIDPPDQSKFTIDYLPYDVLERSLACHKHCNLFPFLTRLFGDNIASQLCIDYLIGSNKKRDTVFWQADINDNIRQCKIIRYNSLDGKRKKDIPVRFAGKEILKNNKANLVQCFFGENLLSFSINDDKPIGIVESEKTAVIASIYYPHFVWLATGGTHGCKWTQKSVCDILTGRKVIIFPDINSYDIWCEKARLISATVKCKVVVSDLLENGATNNDRVNGYDLADYLIKFPYTDLSKRVL